MCDKYTETFHSTVTTCLWTLVTETKGGGGSSKWPATTRGFHIIRITASSSALTFSSLHQMLTSITKPTFSIVDWIYSDQRSHTLTHIAHVWRETSFPSRLQRVRPRPVPDATLTDADLPPGNSWDWEYCNLTSITACPSELCAVRSTLKSKVTYRCGVGVYSRASTCITSSNV